MTLTQEQYEAALAELAEYERRIAESDRLSQADSLKKAEVLAELFGDSRWVEERNAERAETAKTPRGGRPVDPTSRSQFSTWVRGRYRHIAPSTTYQLLTAHQIKTEFLLRAETTPTSEYQVRPLKNLLKVAHGSGARIPEVWGIAVKLADGGQPTKDQVRQAIAEWERVNLPKGMKRREQATDRAQRLANHIRSEFRQLLDAEYLGTAQKVLNELVEEFNSRVGD